MKPLTGLSIPTVVRAPLSIIYGYVDPVVAASNTYRRVVGGMGIAMAAVVVVGT